MTLDKRTAAVGFIGLGIMGGPMAGHLLAGGWRLNVFNRSKAKADPLLANGATWCGSVAEVARASDVVITIIGYPKDVEATYLGPQGLIANGKPGAIFVDMTTSTPELAQRIAKEGAARGIAVLDAPVSGGEMGAKNGKLTIMCGGDGVAFETVRPLLSLMGTNVVLQGGAGAGQHTKVVNQIVTSATILGIAEAMAYARAAGLDPTNVLASISKGSAASFHLDNTAPKIIAGDSRPGFQVHHLVKDLEIAVAQSQAAGLDLKALRVCLEQWRALLARGGATLGTQAVATLYTPGG